MFYDHVQWHFVQFNICSNSYMGRMAIVKLNFVQSIFWGIKFVQFSLFKKTDFCSRNRSPSKVPTFLYCYFCSWILHLKLNLESFTSRIQKMGNSEPELPSDLWLIPTFEANWRTSRGRAFITMVYVYEREPHFLTWQHAVPNRSTAMNILLFTKSYGEKVLAKE